jgi:hypothetical protein
MRASEIWWSLGAGLNLRWRLRALRHSWRGLGGDFKRGEVSARAMELTARWYQKWPTQPPLAPGVPVVFGADEDRWVRFHSLPESKQFPDTEGETLELLNRHFTALRELSERYGLGELQVILCDWNTNDLAGGWTKEHAPGSWPWVSWKDPDDDPKAPPAFYWVTPMASLGELRDLLLFVANEGGNATITDREVTWLYAPYAGGADVFFPSAEDRNDFRNRHLDWLPKEELGS